MKPARPVLKIAMVLCTIILALLVPVFIASFVVPIVPFRTRFTDMSIWRGTLECKHSYERFVSTGTGTVGYQPNIGATPTTLVDVDRIGIRIVIEPRSRPYGGVYVRLPLHLPILIFLAPVTIFAIYQWRVIRIQKRRSANVCNVCGYDLRASPDRCPECGTDPNHISPTGRSLAPADQDESAATDRSDS